MASGDGYRRFFGVGGFSKTAMEEDKKIQKVLSRLQGQCSKREYCTGDVREKALKALDGDSEAAEKVVSSLVADRYVDDERYCAAYAREKASISGWGAVKIRYALSGKGLGREDIDSGLAEIDSEAARGRLQKILQVKRHSLEGDPQWKLKLIRFALGRGYGYEEVSAAIKALPAADSE